MSSTVEHRHDRQRFSRLAESFPSVHDPTPFIQRIAAPVCPLSLIANDMGQSRLGNLAREVGGLAAPIAEARSEAVDCVGRSHPFPNQMKSHVAERPARFVTGEDKFRHTSGLHCLDYRKSPRR